jgi:hypothetical protein
MSSRSRTSKVKPEQILSLAVLAGIVFTSALVPLKPVMQQALIGIALVWIGVSVMFGCGY